jgi:hypothetical protein
VSECLPAVPLPGTYLRINATDIYIYIYTYVIYIYMVHNKTKGKGQAAPFTLELGDDPPPFFFKAPPCPSPLSAVRSMSTEALAAIALYYTATQYNVIILTYEGGGGSASLLLVAVAGPLVLVSYPLPPLSQAATSDPSWSRDCDVSCAMTMRHAALRWCVGSSVQPAFLCPPAPTPLTRYCTEPRVVGRLPLPRFYTTVLAQRTSYATRLMPPIKPNLGEAFGHNTPGYLLSRMAHGAPRSCTSAPRAYSLLLWCAVVLIVLCLARLTDLVLALELWQALSWHSDTGAGGQPMPDASNVSRQPQHAPEGSVVGSQLTAAAC